MTLLDPGVLVALAPAAAGVLAGAVPVVPADAVPGVVVPAVLAALAVAVAVGLPLPDRLSGFPPDRTLSERSARVHQADRGAREGPVVELPEASPGASPGSSPGTSLAPLAAHAAVPLALAAVLLVWSGPAAAALGLLLAALGRRWWDRRLDRLARESERAGASEALAVLAGELTAGRTPATALEAAASVAVGPFGRALAAAARSGRFGADAGECLLRGAEQSAVPEVLRGLAACWQVCSSTGSSLAAAVERLSEGLRAEHAQRLTVEAELAGPRATAGLLAVLPLAGILLASGLGARPLHVLFETPIGVGCLVAGVGLDLLGVWWTGRLVAAAGGSR